MILHKKFDPMAYFMGKSATARKIGWNQATSDSKDVQLRVNFQLPPFAIADVRFKQTVNLSEIPIDWINWLGCDSLEEYLKKYEDCNKSDNLEREFIKFENIRLNPDFPWIKFGLTPKDVFNMSENKYCISFETAEKIRNVGKSSKYYLTKADKKNGFYTSIRVEDGSIIDVPFKAMFFKGTNTKLGKIVSISADSATDCLSHKMGFCQLPDNVECYGKASEKQYCRKDIINCEESNKISGLILLSCQAYKMAEYIAKKFPAHEIRFNKHGDFINDTHLLNFLCICDWLRIEFPEADVHWFGYTCRDDLMDAYKLDAEYWQDRQDVTLNGSNKMYTNRFKGVWELSGKNPSCINDCETCGNCYKLKGKTIEVRFHGNINSH